MSFGMLGCDLHCGYCQNWITSQALRDPLAEAPPIDISPDEFLALTKKYHARVVASTYNEPLITSEWAVEIFRKAKQEELLTAFISNGNATEEVIDYLKPWLDLFKVDLKTFRDKNYRKLGGRLEPVLKTIAMLSERKFWLEVVTLVVPGFNDSDEELTEIAKFIVSVNSKIPWHITAFHQNYKMTSPENTTVHHLKRAVEIGKENGLNYVYAGNLPGQVGEFENTFCHNCNTLLIERKGFHILQNFLQEAKCPKCQILIPGVWN
jgi:pyruvate formate lyase activating enzyme